MPHLEVLCPKCNSTMEKGYINSPRQIYWSKSNKATWTGMGDEEIVKLPMFKMKKLKANRCEKCHLVLFEYD